VCSSLCLILTYVCTSLCLLLTYVCTSLCLLLTYECTSLCLILTYVCTSPIFQLVIVTQTVKVVYQQRLILSVAGVESSTNVPTAWIGSDRNGSTLDAQNM